MKPVILRGAFYSYKSCRLNFPITQGFGEPYPKPRLAFISILAGCGIARYHPYPS